MILQQCTPGAAPPPTGPVSNSLLAFPHATAVGLAATLNPKSADCRGALLGVGVDEAGSECAADRASTARVGSWVDVFATGPPCCTYMMRVAAFSSYR